MQRLKTFARNISKRHDNLFKVRAYTLIYKIKHNVQIYMHTQMYWFALKESKRKIRLTTWSLSSYLQGKIFMDWFFLAFSEIFPNS